MELTKREKKKLRLDPNSTEQIAQETIIPAASEKKGIPKKYIVLSIIGIFIIAIAAYSVISYNKPGQYDGFAKCLAEKGAVMYGALGWCKYTQGQKAMFGRSFKYLNYKEFTELPGIKKTPTWVINGKWYENTQSFDKLSEITGCRI